jgi:hypothetical protein
VGRKMYNIGYLNLAEEPSYGWEKLFEDSKYTINQLEIADWDIFKDQGIVIIEDKAVSDLSVICKLLLEAKKHPEVLVYIVSPVNHLEKSIREVYLQLGVNGIKDASTDWEEFSLIIKNLAEKILERNMAVSEIMYRKKTQYDIQLEPSNLSVLIDDNEILLTRLEYKILEELFKSVGKTVTYEQISNKIWGNCLEEKKYRVANMIFHIRKKIESSNLNSEFIKTIRSKGYMLVI